MFSMCSPGPTAALMGSGCRQCQSKHLVASGPPIRAENHWIWGLVSLFLDVLQIQVEFIP